MEYEEIRLLKQSDKSTVHLVREKGGSRVLVRKKLAGRHPVYQTLQKNPHPGLPRLYEVAIAEDSTTVIEEYIEGQTSGEAELSGKQFRQVVRELCAVLEFLHGKGIIHRDIKPSNILLTEECHVRLIDFDAARMPREGGGAGYQAAGNPGIRAAGAVRLRPDGRAGGHLCPGGDHGTASGGNRPEAPLSESHPQMQESESGQAVSVHAAGAAGFFPGGGRRGMWAAAALILAAIAGLGAAGRSTLRQGADRESDGGG